MIKYGSIVLQKNTLVNKVNYKDNKENRFSVVLFEFNLNNEVYFTKLIGEYNIYNITDKYIFQHFSTKHTIFIFKFNISNNIKDFF